MKINDIIAEAGILGSIGRGLAGAATGAIRMLDKAGGGDGTNVGTVAQRAAYTNKIKQTQNAKARAKANLPAAAFAEFNNALKQNNINLQNPQSFDPASITDYLKSFAENYFAVGDEYHNNNQLATDTIKAGVLQALNQIPLPTTINNISVQDYLEKANTRRTSIIDIVDKRMAIEKSASPSDLMQTAMANQPDAVLKNALGFFLKEKNPNPEVRAAITQIGAELVRRGFSRNQQPSQNTSNTTTNTATNVANTTVPPAAADMINTLTINTQGGMRKFFIDKKEKWWEYVGNDWPNEIEMSLLVNDDATIDYLSAQVADGNLKQEPYSKK